MAVRKRKPTKSTASDFCKRKTLAEMDANMNYKNHAMSLCDQANEALSNLEAKLSNIIRRINSINTL